MADVDVGVLEHRPEGAGRQAGSTLEIQEAPLARRVSLENHQVTENTHWVIVQNPVVLGADQRRDGIGARVLDLYSVKPADTEALLAAAAATGDRIVVAEDHYPAGGIGEAALEAFNDAGHPVQIAHLAVRGLPGSGTPQELMEAAGISASHIAQAAREILGG